MVYKPGSWKVVCDTCGLTYYNTECRKTWNNLIVCAKCYDGPRDPLDFPPPRRPERQTVPDARPLEKVTPTIIETVAVNTITDTTAASGGNVTNNGGSAITAYGVCWSTSHAPDVDDDVTDEGTGTAGEFTSAITGLTASTKYYVRAYATNGIGTGYGPEAEFTTTA